MLNVRTFDFILFSTFAWLRRTVRATSGRIRCKRVPRLCPKNNWTGNSPVVDCGALRYAIRKFASFFGTVPWSYSADFMADLNVCKNRSASPLVFGWYDEDVVWQIPFIFMKRRNSTEINCGPFSDTMSRKSVSRENSAQDINGTLSGDTLHREHFRPFRPRVNYDQKHGP